MTRKDQLRRVVAEANAELSKIRAREDEERNRYLVGKCFKYQNSYSLPKESSDYWWMYARITSVDGGLPRAFEFQTDKYGKVEITPEAIKIAVTDGYEEIPETEFNAAWQATMERLERL